MKRIRNLVLCLLCGLARPAAAAQPPQPAGAARDSLLRAEVAAPDFLRASLVVVAPGREVYSAYGHSALRLECPSRGLDFCFTFEMDLSLSSRLDFVLRRARAGFAPAPTPLFLQQYRAEQRTVQVHPLNLSPLQEQELWRVLDREVKRGPAWRYDYPGVNCASMVAHALRQALGSDRLVYGPLPAGVGGTYRQVLRHISVGSPWARLFWEVALIGRGSRQGRPEETMTPAFLAQAWSQAQLVDSLGRRRPLFSGPVQTLYQAPLAGCGTWFTPWMALLLLLLLGSAAWGLYAKRKRTLLSYQSKHQ